MRLLERQAMPRYGPCLPIPARMTAGLLNDAIVSQKSRPMRRLALKRCDE